MLYGLWPPLTSACRTGCLPNTLSVRHCTTLYALTYAHGLSGVFWRTIRSARPCSMLICFVAGCVMSSMKRESLRADTNTNTDTYQRGFVNCQQDVVGLQVQMGPASSSRLLYG